MKLAFKGLVLVCYNRRLANPFDEFGKRYSQRNDAAATW